jgi:hypothetical protein
MEKRTDSRESEVQESRGEERAEGFIYFATFNDAVGSSLYVVTVLTNSRNIISGMLLSQLNGSEKNHNTSKQGGRFTGQNLYLGPPEHAAVQLPTRP